MNKIVLSLLCFASVTASAVTPSYSAGDTTNQIAIRVKTASGYSDTYPNAAQYLQPLQSQLTGPDLSLAGINVQTQLDFPTPYTAFMVMDTAQDKSAVYGVFRAGTNHLGASALYETKLDLLTGKWATPWLIETNSLYDLRNQNFAVLDDGSQLLIAQVYDKDGSNILAKNIDVAVYRSFNNGASYQRIASLPLVTNTVSTNVAFDTWGKISQSPNGTLFTGAYCQNDTAALAYSLKSSNFGTNWTAVPISTNVTDGVEPQLIAVNDAVILALIRGGTSHNYVSRDGGMTWTNLADTTTHAKYGTPPGIYLTKFAGNPYLVAATADRGVGGEINISGCSVSAFLSDPNNLTTNAFKLGALGPSSMNIDGGYPSIVNVSRHNDTVESLISYYYCADDNKTNAVLKFLVASPLLTVHQDLFATHDILSKRFIAAPSLTGYSGLANGFPTTYGVAGIYGDNASSYFGYSPAVNENSGYWSVFGVGIATPDNTRGFRFKTDASGTLQTVGQLDALGMFTVSNLTVNTPQGTNVVGSTVKGQLPVTINGVTYYVDLKK